MARINRSPVIYSPATMADLIRIYRLNNDALIYAGGTWSLMGQEGDHFKMRGSVINIMAIEELKKISRTERYLEIGATVSVKKILDLGKTIVPEVLYKALKLSGPPQIRNMSTIGGNICVSGKNTPLFPVLHLLDAQLEVRSSLKKTKRAAFFSRDSHWLSASRFLDGGGSLNLKGGEILTRVRIPNESWSCQSFEITEGISSPLIFTGLANLDKYIITDFRICFSTARERVVRNRDLEADLIGRRIPLTRKEISHLNAKIGENFDNLKETDFTKARAIALTGNFLEKLSIPGLTEVNP